MRAQGFEAEHHKRSLEHLDNVSFYEDHKAGRVGVLTTNDVKHAAMELLNIMLRERRISVCKHLHSREKKAMLIRLREQLSIYSFQFKAAITTFQKDRTALSGKVGGMRDDLCIALQLGCYWTSVDILQANQQNTRVLM